MILKENSKTWALWVGVLLILAACVFAYITTKPAEANLSLIKEGARFTYHSDSPISVVNPLRYISEGVDRLWQKLPREVLGPQERVTVDDAIRAVTINI